jgi:hypothetical protein
MRITFGRLPFSGAANEWAQRKAESSKNVGRLLFMIQAKTTGRFKD